MKAELLSYWGSDLVVVNNARVSFNKESSWTYKCRSCGQWDQQPEDGCGTGPCMFQMTLKPEDQRLIGYLARGVTKADYEEMIEELRVTGEEDRIIEIVDQWRRTPEHWAPFANGNGLRFRIKAPIPIMRQVFKHKIGSVESEVSRRYVDDPPEVFHPTWRERPREGIKQGSGDFLKDKIEEASRLVYKASVDRALQAYKDLIYLGVAPEQARFVLPQGTYTEAIVSNSLYGWARFYNQRSDRSHAQAEIADLADQIGKAAAERFPISWEALTR